MTNQNSALSIILIASAMNGAFSLPMKRMRQWSWQSSWLAWSLFALVLLPSIVAAATIPHPFSLLAQLPVPVLAQVLLYGAGWGVAQVLFGLAMDAAGLAIAFTLVLGTSACLGSLLPLVLFPDHPPPNREMLLSGVLLMVVGLAICAYAGRSRELEIASRASSLVGRHAGRGVALSIVSGLCAGCMNLGLIAATPLLHLAVQAGSRPYFATNLAWMPLLAAGAVPNILYCVFLSRRAKTSNELLRPSTVHYYLLALLMAILWFGSSLAYGVATYMLGDAGPVIGWPVYMSMIVLVAGLLGFSTGEWKGVRRSYKRWQWVGMAVLICGVFVLSRNHG